MATDEPHQLPLSWVGLEDAPILFANQYLCQFQPAGEFVLTIGQLTPPPIVGTPEEMEEQIRNITYVPIRTIARVGMTRARLAELIGVLQANLDNHDKAMEGFDPR